MNISKTNGYAAAAIAAAMVFTAGAASSATITSWNTTTDNPVIDTAPTLTVDDSTNADSLTFTIATPNSNGLLSGVFLDFGTGFTFESNDLMSLTTGISIVAFEAPSDGDVGNGVNLGGNFTPDTQPSGDFSLGFGFDDGDNGGAARQIVTPFVFKLSDLGGTLSLDDLERVGLRFQSVGTLGQNGLGDGSEKLIGLFDNGGGGGGCDNGDCPPPVPLPAGLPLILAGIGAFGVLRMHKKRS